MNWRAAFRNLARHTARRAARFDNADILSDLMWRRATDIPVDPVATPKKRGEAEEAVAKLSESERVFAARRQRGGCGAPHSCSNAPFVTLPTARWRSVTLALKRLKSKRSRQAAELPDPAEKRESVEAAEIAAEDALMAFEDAETPVVAEARSAEAFARGPVDLARNRLNALET